MSFFTKENFDKAVGQIAKGTKEGAKVIGTAAEAGTDFVARKAGDLKTFAQEKHALYKETERIIEEGNETLNKFQAKEAAARSGLTQELENFRDLIERMDKGPLLLYAKFCKYADTTPIASAGRHGDEEALYKPEVERAAGPVVSCAGTGAAAGATAGALAVGAMTALGSASTGTALASLSGAAYGHALLAAFGGGSLAAGGLGMAGGAVVLGSIVAVPAAAATAWAAAWKVDKDYEKAQTFVKEVIEYGERVDAECLRLDSIRRAFRALGAEMYSFCGFFHEMLNMAAVAEAVGDSSAYRVILEEAAMTLIGFMEIPIEKDGKLSPAFEPAFSDMCEKAVKCHTRLYEYSISLNSREQKSMAVAAQYDISVYVDDIKSHIDEVARSMGKGIHEHIRGVERHLDSIDETLGSIKADILSYGREITALQRELSEKLPSQTSDSAAFEEALSEFADKVIGRLMESAALSGNVLREAQKKKLSAKFGADWERLMPLSKKYLITAKVMYSQMEAITEDMDYSGVCLLAAKALEIELKKRFFDEYSRYVEERFPFAMYPEKWPSCFADRDVRNGAYKRSRKKFTLGSMPYICGIKMPGHVTDKMHEQDCKIMMEYAEEKLLKPEAAADKRVQMLQEIAEQAAIVTEKYRNPAAHTNALKEKEARECFDMLIDVERVMQKMMAVFA